MPSQTTCRACYGSGVILTVMDIGTGYSESEPCPLCQDESEETVCPGCMRMASDNEPTTLIDTPYHFKSEVRCGECRAMMAKQKEAA